MYLVTDGSHVDTVAKTLTDVAFEMTVRYDYFRFGLSDCYFTPEQKNISKGFTFYAYEVEDGEVKLYDQYFCTYTKINSLEGLSKDTLDFMEA